MMHPKIQWKFAATGLITIDFHAFIIVESLKSRNNRPEQRNSPQHQGEKEGRTGS